MNTERYTGSMASFLLQSQHADVVQHSLSNRLAQCGFIIDGEEVRNPICLSPSAAMHIILRNLNEVSGMSNDKASAS